MTEQITNIAAQITALAKAIAADPTSVSYEDARRVRKACVAWGLDETLSAREWNTLSRATHKPEPVCQISGQEGAAQ